MKAILRSNRNVTVDVELQKDLYLDEIKDGVRKEHREGYIRLQYIGKQLLPMPVPERYILVVQDSTGKARGVKVSAESYYRIEIGDSVNLR